jgi:hypothetical protein
MAGCRPSAFPFPKESPRVASDLDHTKARRRDSWDNLANRTPIQLPAIASRAAQLLQHSKRMSKSPEHDRALAEQLELVCAELDVLGMQPWSQRGEFLDRWAALSEERSRLRSLLGIDEDSP